MSIRAITAGRSSTPRARLGSHDVAIADLYVGDFQTNADNEVLVRRTTADGTYGADPAGVNYYFGNLDERRMTWSVGRDLILNPKQDGEPVNAWQRPTWRSMERSTRKSKTGCES
jgi:hypothetical protein